MGVPQPLPTTAQKCIDLCASYLIYFYRNILGPPWSAAGLAAAQKSSDLCASCYLGAILPKQFGRSAAAAAAVAVRDESNEFFRCLLFWEKNWQRRGCPLVMHDRQFLVKTLCMCFSS